jgi:hypothetical protein
VLEEAGIRTVVISTARDISAQVRPPRTVFVNAPMGNTFGRPFDRVRQRAILLDALRVLETVAVAGTLIDSPHEWDEAFDLKLGGTSAQQTTA